MKETQQQFLHKSEASRPPEAFKERRTLPTTAEILARGVSLSQVQQAVRKLRPNIDQAG